MSFFTRFRRNIGKERSFVTDGSRAGVAKIIYFLVVSFLLSIFIPGLIIPKIKEYRTKCKALGCMG